MEIIAFAQGEKRQPRVKFHAFRFYFRNAKRLVLYYIYLLPPSCFRHVINFFNKSLMVHKFALHGVKVKTERLVAIENSSSRNLNNL